MTTIDLTRFGFDPQIGGQRALEYARHRLLELASDLDKEATDATLRQTAAELEGIVHRIRWLADVAADDM